MYMIWWVLECGRILKKRFLQLVSEWKSHAFTNSLGWLFIVVHVYEG